MINAHGAVSPVSGLSVCDRPVRSVVSRRPAQWGLLADAGEHGVTIELHERLGRRPLWRLTVGLADAWFSADLDSPDALRPAADLLAVRSPTIDRASLGRWNRSPMTLTRDDEFDDRAFVLVGLPEGPVVRFTYAGLAFHGLTKALRDVVDQLAAG